MGTKGIRNLTSTVAALCLLGALFVLSGCASSMLDSGEESGAGGESSSEGMAREQDLPDSAASPSGGQEIAAVDQDSADTAATGDEGSFERRVIKTADLGLTSGNVRETASIAQVIAERAGGNVMSSQLDRSDGRVSAYLVLDVPSSEFEKTLEELRGLGESVTTDAVQGQDVTEEFVDLEARERNLLAAEESLLDLYEQAEDVKGTLAIQRELTTVRGEIEQVQGRIRYLEQRTDFSQISVSIQPAIGAPGAKATWSPTEVAEGAWSASLALLQGLATATISVLVFSWWLIPFVLLAVYLWRRRRARRTSPPAATPPTEA